MGDGQKRDRAIHLLSKLCEAHGGSGNEDPVRSIFREELQSGVTTDRMGNVFCERKGVSERPRIMVSGHMDEVGFMVQSVSKSGLIKFIPAGGWWAHVLLAQRVRIRTREGNEIVGVIGAKPPHLLGEGEREKVVKVEDMFIDVGASSADEVFNQFGISLGDPIVPDSPFTPMHNPDYLMCKAFDNRVGMALTIQVMQLLDGIPHPNSVWGVGTVQEEVGIRGATTAPFTVNPDAAIVLEGAPADDFPGIPEDERQGILGGGVQIRIVDPSAIMNSRFVRYVAATAQRNGIPYQMAVKRSGGTDARAIHLHATGVPTVVLSVPARYIHTHSGIIRIDDYLSALNLVVKVIEGLDAAEVDGFTSF